MKQKFTQFDHTGLTLYILNLRRAGQDDLDRAAAALFDLFVGRKEVFAFNPAIAVDYPELDKGAKFLREPLGYIADRIAALEKDGASLSRIAVLTTWGDRLHDPLVAAGYRATPIDMPAGPDFTTWFEKGRMANTAERTLYLEAVDEADEKIRPGFVLELRDEAGRLRGGACGAVHDRGGRRFCYLATMTLDAGLAPATGLKLGAALLDYLRGERVGMVHLGTQTAGPFYEKLGFRVTHTLLRDLRSRRLPGRAPAITDLVMMERPL